MKNIIIKLSIKEKAGITDTSKIFEGLHLNEEFIKNVADEQKRKNLDKEILEEGERHFGICDKCRQKFEELKKEPKEQDLPL